MTIAPAIAPFTYFAKTPLELLPAAIREGRPERLMALLHTASGARTLQVRHGAPACLQQDDATNFREGGQCLKRQDYECAISFFASVMKKHLNFAPAWAMLGMCLGQSGFPAAEIHCQEQALSIDPHFAEAGFCLASSLKNTGQLRRAAEIAASVVADHPDFARAWYLLGVIRFGLGDYPQALAAAEQALRADPGMARAQMERGNALQAMKQLEPAFTAYQAALALQPDYAEAYSNMGCVLQEMGQMQAAILCCEEAIRIRPDYAGAQRNLGTALHTLGRFGEAAACYRRVLTIDPHDADAMSYLGTAHADVGQSETAVGYYDAALRSLSRSMQDLQALGQAARPAAAPLDLANIQVDRSMALLKAGQLREGFQAYEARWQGVMPPHGIMQPQWRGEPLLGRTILLHAEQGMGDTLQFVRYAQIVGLGGRVILEVQKPLVRLFRSVPHVHDVIGVGDPRPDFDLHCPLMSLPAAFGTELDTIPAAIPYLFPDEALVREWGARIPEGDGLKVGLVWAGDPRLSAMRTYFTDRRRSLHLRQCAALAMVPGIRWFSLQLGAAAEQAHETPHIMKLIDLTADLHDFADTAALMQHLDLVIAVDTSSAHLAGALGKPIWLLSRSDNCWRWLQNTSTSPWYPSLRLYRQPQPDNWTPILEQAAHDLRALAAERG